MDCARARELLQEELDARIAPADAAALAEHVTGCGACAAERRGLASLRATFRAMPRAQAPAGFREDVMSALPRKGRLRILPRALGWLVAAAAVVVVAVTLNVRRRSEERAVATGVFAEKSEDRVVPPARGPSDPPPPSEVMVPREQTDATTKAEEEADKLDSTRSAPTPAADAAAVPAGKAGKPTAVTPRATEVRYVVFRDAEASRRFLEALAAADVPADRRKDVDKKSADDLPPDAGFVAPQATSPSKPAEVRERAEEGATVRAKETAREGYLVIARRPLPTALAEADLVALAAKSGGSVATGDESVALADAVDPPPPPETGPSTPGGGEDLEKGKRGGGPPPPQPPAPSPPAPTVRAPESPKVERKAPPPPVPPAPVVIVVVVVEKPAAASGAAK